MTERVVRRWEPRSINPNSPALRQLGDALYNLRLRAGLTQQALANLSGGRWSRSHIGRVENGDVTPSLDFVEAMDALLGGDRSLIRRLPMPPAVLFHQVRQCRQLVGSLLDQPQW